MAQLARTGTARCDLPQGWFAIEVPLCTRMHLSPPAIQDILDSNALTIQDTAKSRTATSAIAEVMNQPENGNDFSGRSYTHDQTQLAVINT
jgi:hypothetical protein